MAAEVTHKFSQIRQLLDQTYKKKKKGKSSGGYVVGLFTTQQQSEVTWIEAELKLGGELVKEVRYVNPSNCKVKDIDKAMSECTFYIYILTEHKWKNLLTTSEKKKALASFGKKNLIVLIVDMEDSSDEERTRIIKALPYVKDCAMDLFLFQKVEEKSDKPQDRASDGGSMSGSPGGSSEHQLAAANVERIRKLSHPLPQPDGAGGSSENKLPPNVGQFRNLPYRLPQPEGTGLQTAITQRLTDRKHIVGIFTRSGEQDFAWLARLLTEAFQDCVGEVKHCYISNNGYQNLSEDLSQCTFGILYHSKNRGRVHITNVKESLYDEELETLSAELGRRNTIVLIDDLRDGSDEEKAQILQTQPSINKLACDLILISASDKENKLKMATKMKNLKFIFAGEHSALKMQNAGKAEHPVNPRPEPQNLANGAGNASPVQSKERMPVAVPPSSKPTVAIFSRSEESDFSWLSQQLSSEGLDVRTYKISSLNRDQPHEMAFQCKLVILYHNMHDGKLRLTDAKDAMYHEELEMLSYKFGKRRVIVVVDDLVESNDKIKGEILERQPSTGRFARDLFLVSMKEKKHFHKKDSTKEGRKLMDKISAIKEMVNK